MNPAIALSQLRYTYPGTDQPVLEIPEWRVEQGQCVFLYGPSGAGKSTLLNLLGGLLLSQQGEVEILGTDIKSLSAYQRDRFRASYIGYIFQQFNLLPYLSVLDNIRLAASFGSSPLDEAALLALIDSLGLAAGVLNARADALSVGQQQRVAIARALVNQPQLMIADEPTSALDDDFRDRFVDLLIEQVRAQGSTLIFVSHDRRLARHFDQTVNLAQINSAASLATESWGGQ
jgi:putative ABC transport system ATP-binding protein